MAHIFISYSTQNRTYALSLAEQLRQEGFDVWIDNRRLHSSEDWWKQIVMALRDAAAVVVLLSPESDQSKWVQREITLAEKYNKPIYPLLLDGDMNTPNWEIFVRTQIENVKGGKLPDAPFYENLAQHTARQANRRGNDVTIERSTQKIPSFPIQDQDFEQDVAEPPPVETTPLQTTAPQHLTPPATATPRRLRSNVLIGVVALVVIGIVATLIISNNGKKDVAASPTSTVTLPALLPTVAEVAANTSPEPTAIGGGSGQISYLSASQNGYYNLYITDLQSQISYPLTQLERNILAYSWSPDGTRVALIDSSALYTLRAEKDAELQLVASGKFNDVQWSPDGTQLALNMDEGLVLMTLSGKKTLVASPDAQGRTITDYWWSPDGNQLAYSMQSFDQLTASLFLVTVNPLGRAEEIATDFTPCFDTVHSLIWSADSQQLSYSMNNEMFNLYHVATAEVTSHRFGTPCFAWSVQGDKIAAFINNYDQNSSDAQITLYDHANHGAQIGTIPFNHLISELSWSPDGHWLLFGEWYPTPINYNVEVFALSLDDPNAKPLRLTSEYAPDDGINWRPQAANAAALDTSQPLPPASKDLIGIVTADPSIPVYQAAGDAQPSGTALRGERLRIVGGKMLDNQQWLLTDKGLWVKADTVVLVGNPDAQVPTMP